MSMQWTEEQQQVIDTRNANILVSAAAGSGKTAVLVERIIQRILDEREPMDIDRLLVVTFTNAAASEMKERIRLAIEERLVQNPENTHLQKQSSLIHHAQITTIHSFCSYILRNHFHRIGLDPSFRIGEEGELSLMKNDVVKQLLEEAYAQRGEAFDRFVETFATGKKDDVLEDMILKLYEFSMSDPWPMEWLDRCLAAYPAGGSAAAGGIAAAAAEGAVDHAVDSAALEETVWMKQLMENITLTIAELCEETEFAIQIALSEGGPFPYEEALQNDLFMLQQMAAETDYRGLAGWMENLTFMTLSSKRGKDIDPVKREMVKAVRSQIKDTLKDVQEQFFFQEFTELVADMRRIRPVMEELIALTKEFAARFQQEKEGKNIVDFNDLEHLALQILVTKEEDRKIPSAVARELSDYYVEIMTDEYQDSNLVQETLLWAVSGEAAEEGKRRQNRFMVGDVKQSIYRFRRARPQLFMEKYEQYSMAEDGSGCRRIDLHKNFRSRHQVLETVNFLFYQIMGRQLGSVEYDQDAALYPGAQFPDAPDGIAKEEFCRTEVMILPVSRQERRELDVEETARELEAIAVAGRIQKMVGKEQIIDKKSGEYRPVRYSDIVILLRSVEGWADVFSENLQKQGIPAYSGTRTGYFSALEVRTVLDLLKVVDNPRQDIPLTSVLVSPIGGLDAEALAKMKGSQEAHSIYESCIAYAADGSDETVRIKLCAFLDQLNGFRSRVAYTPISKLLQSLLEETGYGRYAAAMPGGRQRKANLDMLVEKAIAYENGSYRGLFHFVRYMEQMNRFQLDYGEAPILGENEDIVRIMTIHKSKGLEFPVVFLSGCGKRFNNRDMQGAFALHPEWGIGTDFVDPILRIKAPTLLKKTIHRQTKLENLGEELRVLYVALTRAKEKLILTGTMENPQKKLAQFSPLLDRQETKLPYYRLASANTYWDYILPALLRHQSMAPVLEEYGLPNAWQNPLYQDPAPLAVRVLRMEELIQAEYEEALTGYGASEEFYHWQDDRIYDKEARAQLQRRLYEQYPYQKDRDIDTKITVSELKRRGQHTDETYSRQLVEEPEIVPYVPQFVQEREGLTNTARGTAYHRLLEFLDLDQAADRVQLQQQVDRLVEEKKLSPDMAAAIFLPGISKFAASSLAGRIRKAQHSREVWKEQQFVLGVPADQVENEWSREETVLIQGIIDLYFQEAGELVLVDYKTDYLEQGEEQKLVNRYKTQLDYYQLALERLTGKKVKEKIIYSFSLNKEIYVD